jgi:undecaprenyl-diphosphatase
MGIIDAIILGVVEGITEFLPVSSTGHLIVTSHFLDIEQSAKNKAFEIIIQFAAILAVLFAYKKHFTFQKIALWQKIALAFLPVGTVGFLLASTIKSLFSVQIVAWAFIAGGIVFLIVERYYKEESHHIDSVDDVSYKQAFYVGLAQVFSLIPGTSRAGATIIGALLVGLTRKASAEFSFLLAIPVMIAVTGYDLVNHYHEFAGAHFWPLAVGFIVSFIVAYGAMRAFIAFLAHFTFVAFGIYRIILGAVLLLFFI